MFRSPDEQSLIDAAYDRARAAHASLQALAQAAAQKNAARRMAGRPMINLGTYAPPAMPPASGASAADIVRMLDGQAQWFAGEAQRIRSELNDPADVPAAPRTLAPAPREVPLFIALLELTRTPWLWLRWLLFPPFTMLAAVAVGAVSTRSAEAAAGLLLGAVALTWAAGIRAGLRRVALLARGEVPVILQREEKVYRTRNTNIPMLRAHGWDVSLEVFTGMSRGTTFVVQTTRAVIGRVSVDHGPPFDGILLVDPETAQGCAHMEFASLPVPDERGQWRADVPLRVWLGFVGGVLISLAMLGGALAVLQGYRIVR